MIEVDNSITYCVFIAYIIMFIYLAVIKKKCAAKGVQLQ